MRSGVALDQADNPFETGAELFLDFTARADLGGSHGLGAQFGDGLERRPFVPRVLIDGRDQPRNEVVAALQLNVDIAPRGADTIAAADETVVEDYTGYEDQHQNDDDGSDHGQGLRLTRSTS